MSIQYTINGISSRLDKRIRDLSRSEGKSLNETVLAILESGAGLSKVPIRYADLDHLAGSWINDPEFDKAIEEMDRIDPELWK